MRKVRLQRPRIGCALVGIVLLVGLTAGGIMWGPRWVDRLTGRTATVTSDLDDTTTYLLNDRTSPDHLAARRAQELAHLQSYGWVDQAAGIAHIPIDQAMLLVAERGLPVRAAVPTQMEQSAGGAPDAAPADPTSGPSSELPADLANLNYAEHVLPIFEQHCAECHGAEDPEEGLELTRYHTAIVGSEHGPVIEPGDPDNSYLVKQIVEGRMPKEGDPLSPAEIELIIAWIRAGAPEN